MSPAALKLFPTTIHHRLEWRHVTYKRFLIKWC